MLVKIVYSTKRETMFIKTVRIVSLVLFVFLTGRWSSTKSCGYLSQHLVRASSLFTLLYELWAITFPIVGGNFLGRCPLQIFLIRTHFGLCNNGNALQIVLTWYNVRINFDLIFAVIEKLKTFFYPADANICCYC